MDNPIFITFYTITRLLCAFSLVVDRDLLKNTQTDGVKSTSDHTLWRHQLSITVHTRKNVIYLLIIVQFYSRYQFEEAAYNCIHLKNRVYFLQLEFSNLENHGGKKGIALCVFPFHSSQHFPSLPSPLPMHSLSLTAYNIIIYSRIQLFSFAPKRIQNRWCVHNCPGWSSSLQS